MGCTLCPRRCGAERNEKAAGFCSSFSLPVVARASLHMWEEPPISGTRGSGTVFFAGCNLRCVYCQNRAISRGSNDNVYTPQQLCDVFLQLEEQGAHNVNLVTAAHVLPAVAEAIALAKPKLHVPVVYNTSSYETVEALRMLDGLVDIYLPDFKYVSPNLSAAYSSAPDYANVAKAALTEMHRQVGAFRTDSEGMMQGGMIVRHLVLPGCRKDSMEVLSHLAALFPVDQIRLSLMSQYTPDFAADAPYTNLHRRVTTFEYRSVLKHAEDLGFEGYFQDISSAKSDYTPNF